ncbi:increased DNA methylation 1-like [Macadamia integrifolia]|uniref:increased DNA methylation 1-like n=1 Tax=Macadamia integrifolia TaxID=60698 RepID=UPI001C4E65A2|nr:increased DNA methylation 1-like [Macadamia integrifolia]
MLFNKEIEGLHDDGFEGSNDERHIFRNTFFGNENGYISKRCLVTGAISYEGEGNEHRNMLSISINENLQLTSPFSTKDLCVEDSCTANENYRHVNCSPNRVGRRIAESGCLQYTSACSVGLSSNKIATKHSPDVGNETQIGTRDEVTSCIFSPDSCYVGQTMACYLVESSGQGVISSCYLLKRQNVDHGDVIDEPGASKCEISTVHGNDVK